MLKKSKMTSLKTKRPIHIAIINGEKVRHDWCSSDLTRATEEDGQEFLGIGKLYSNDGTLQNDTKDYLIFRAKGRKYIN